MSKKKPLQAQFYLDPATYRQQFGLTKVLCASNSIENQLPKSINESSWQRCLLLIKKPPNYQPDRLDLLRTLEGKFTFQTLFKLIPPQLYPWVRLERIGARGIMCDWAYLKPS